MPAETILSRIFVPIGKWLNICDYFDNNDIIVMYHAVGRQWDSPLSVSTQTLRFHLEQLEKRFKVVPIDELGRKNPEYDRRVAITFDDGYKDFHDVVFPILSEYNIPATVFVSPTFLNDENWYTAVKQHPALETLDDSDRAFMNKFELRTVDESDIITVGNHTLTHPDMSNLSIEEAEYQIEEGRRQLEQILNHPVQVFSYPYGGYKSWVYDRFEPLIGQSHEFAVTTRTGHLSSFDNPLRFPRIEATENHRLFDFRMMNIYGDFVDCYDLYREY